MAGSSSRTSSAGFTRVAAHARTLVQGAALARQRTIGTLVRRVGTETVRTISGEILNLPQNKVRPAISVRSEQASDNAAVVVSASKQRLPLTDYKPHVSKSGVTVTTWRDSPPLVLPHAFVRRDKPGIWQRVPFTGAKFGGGAQSGGGKFGLVDRLPIVQRKGPSMHRVFVTESGGRERAHGDVAARLKEVARETLHKEIERLTARRGLA